MNSLLSAVLVAGLLAFSVATPAEDRQGRSWFGGEKKTVTKVILQRQIVTTAIPSSCVVVAPSLPACRNLRALDIEAQPTIQHRIEATPAAVLDSGDREARTFWSGESTAAPVRRRQHVVVSSEQATPIIELEDVDLENVDLDEAAKVTTEAAHRETWGEMLGLSGGDVTVTRHVHRTQTRTVVDPSLVVTFSVTGCEPTRLPFDLDYCGKSHHVKTKLSGGNIASPHIITINEADA